MNRQIAETVVSIWTTFRDIGHVCSISIENMGLEWKITPLIYHMQTGFKRPQLFRFIGLFNIYSSLIPESIISVFWQIYTYSDLKLLRIFFWLPKNHALVIFFDNGNRSQIFFFVNLKMHTSLISFKFFFKCNLFSITHKLNIY